MLITWHDLEGHVLKETTIQVAISPNKKTNVNKKHAEQLRINLKEK